MNKPFVSLWNVPSQKCEKRYGINFDLSSFDIDANSNGGFLGDEVVIFYQGRIGLYPWIDTDGAYVKGGLPQLADLNSHLLQTEKDISTYIPNKSFNGLAVVDWEKWRPIFERNNCTKIQEVYIRASEELVKQKHPDWSEDKIYKEAKRDFEDAARLFMQSTLSLCRKERPGGFWGFWGFPACNNYRRGQSTCSSETREYNDQLGWMFNASSVLVPSIYLQEQLGSHKDRYLHVHGTLEETRRVRQKYSGEYLPILPYTRFKYGDTGSFYDKADLMSTIQQSAYAGFNGVTIWGSSSSFASLDDCLSVRDYVHDTLGPFVKHIAEFMTNCSSVHCNAHGRCLSNEWIGEEERLIAVHYLSVFARMFVFVLSFMHRGFEPTPYSDFNCECYQGWSGPFCEIPNNGIMQTF